MRNVFARFILDGWCGVLAMIFALSAFSVPAGAYDGTSAEDVIAEVARLKTAEGVSTVFTFMGNSGAGYENPAAVSAEVERLLHSLDPRTTIVNVGGTAEGIGLVYPIARAKGFRTMAILASKNKAYEMSADVDLFFFVPDAVSGGYLPGTTELSPTSHAITQVTDVAVAIGGGAVTAVEASTIAKLGKPLTYVPAEMNHEMGTAVALRKGLPRPTGADYLGAAHAILRPYAIGGRCSQAFRL